MSAEERGIFIPKRKPARRPPVRGRVIAKGNPEPVITRQRKILPPTVKAVGAAARDAFEGKEEDEGIFGSVLGAAKGLGKAIVTAPINAALGASSDPRNPGGRKGGLLAAAQATGKVTKATTEFATAGYNPIEYAKLANEARKGDKTAQILLGMSVIPFVGTKPRQLLKANMFGHDAETSVRRLRTAERDLDQYADEQLKDTTDFYETELGYEEGDFTGALLGAGPNAISRMPNHIRERVQEKAGLWADELQKGLDARAKVKPFSGAPGRQWGHPAELSKEEFAASPYAVFHATPSAPGLGSPREGIHAGTVEAAFDRYLNVTVIKGYDRGKKMNLLPLAMRGKVADEEVEDVGSGWMYGTDMPEDVDAYGHGIPKAYKDWTARDMAKARTSNPFARQEREYGWSEQGPGRVDIQPYVNQYEHPGSISFVATQPAAVRTHIDLLRDYIRMYTKRSVLAGGVEGNQQLLFHDILENLPQGLFSYKHPEQLLARLIREITNGRLSNREIIKNARRASLGK